ncbi:MAG: alpha/beta hydrolase [Limnohabitans sp.]|nr:alpha/beta hydrolase [Limnohabitans sp.]
MRKIAYYIFAKSIGLYINTLSFLHPKKASQIARAYLTQPREGKLNTANLPDILKTATTETFNYDTHSFPVYTWRGNDTIILLVHGWESNASRWENLLPYLQKSGSTIIAIDAPAHGLASGIEFSIPQYAEFIHKTVEKYSPKYLIGHSVGGKTCVYYQAHYKNTCVQKIVVLGAPSDFKVIFENFINLLSLNQYIYKDLEQQYIDYYKERIEDFSAQKFASKIEIPALIAHDEEDDVVAYNEGKKIAEAWKNSKFITTKGLGHSMHDDTLYQEVYDFLFVK